MLCESCQENEGVIHHLELTNGEWLERLLCEECHRKNLRGEAAEQGKGAFTVIEYMGQILAQAGGSQEQGQPTAEGGLVCPGCQLSFERFQQTKRLGCPRCYETFVADLEQIFLRVQERVVHRGKVPGRPKTAAPSPLEIRRLQDNLSRAVREERFEDAALFRDQIRKLSASWGETEHEGASADSESSETEGRD